MTCKHGASRSAFFLPLQRPPVGPGLLALVTGFRPRLGHFPSGQSRGGWFRGVTASQRDRSAKQIGRAIVDRIRGWPELEAAHESVLRYQQLVQPAESYLHGTNTLLIVPDGLLGGIPFETLFPRPAGGGNADAGPALRTSPA